MTVTTTEVDAGDGRRVEALHTDITGRPAVVVHNGTPGGLAEWPWLLELADAAGLAPPDLDGLDFADGMGDDNRALFDAAAGGPEALADIGAAYRAMMAEVTAEAACRSSSSCRRSSTTSRRWPRAPRPARAAS